MIAFRFTYILWIKNNYMFGLEIKERRIEGQECRIRHSRCRILRVYVVVIIE